MLLVVNNNVLYKIHILMEKVVLNAINFIMSIQTDAKAVNREQSLIKIKKYALKVILINLKFWIVNKAIFLILPIHNALKNKFAIVHKIIFLTINQTNANAQKKPLTIMVKDVFSVMLQSIGINPKNNVLVVKKINIMTHQARVV
jgi:hypothetical protein